MAKSRIISGKNRGKHIGHACEGHLRGLLKRIPSLKQAKIERSFPFEFHVKPDAVVLDEHGKISTVVIVAFWENADNSHMKYHRTRPEYFELSEIIISQPKLFSETPSILTVLYGSETGWKQLILEEIAQQCPPLIFVPKFELSESTKIWEQAFLQYRIHWENGVKDPSSEVEQWASQKKLTSSEEMFLDSLSSALLTSVTHPSNVIPRIQPQSSHLPEGPYRSRYRQPLSMLSMFNEAEVSAYLANESPGQSIVIDSFIRRATWLDMGVIFLRTRANGEKTLAFRLHEPVDDHGDYAPHLPDYSSWRSGKPEIVKELVDKHRERTANPGKVFKGGASDQNCGNYEDICASLELSIPLILKSIKSGKLNEFIEYIATDHGVSTQPWHPANGSDVIFPAWSFCVCAAATVQGERKLRSNLQARANSVPDRVAIEQCFGILRSSSYGLSLLQEILDFAKVIRSGTLEDLAHVSRSRPSLISNSNACSWLADYYNTIATNSSHNPLNNLLEDWLRINFTGYSWGKSWPNNRTTSLKSIDENYSERRQWAFIGTKGDHVICAECKSVTANHWGDKSKELYDKT